MEISCGSIGGFLFTFFMIERTFADPPLEKPLLRTASAMGAFYVLGIIPMLQWFRTNKDDIQGMQSTLETWGFTKASAIASSMVTCIKITLVLGFVFGLIWVVLYFKNKKQFAWFPILALGITIMFIDLFARLYFYPHPPAGVFIDMRTFTIGIYLAMVLYIVIREWKYPHTPCEVPDGKTEKIPWKTWFASTVSAYLLMLLVSSFINPVLMERTNSPRTRWPIWNKIDDGPYEKRDSIPHNPGK